MALAMEQAQLAAQAGEVPVGAVIVSAEGEMVASGHNQPISTHDPSKKSRAICSADVLGST